MTFDKEVFKNFEEIGLRLKALRKNEKKNISNIRGSEMTHIAVVRVEEGKGSLDGLKRVADLLGATIEVTHNGQNVPIDEVRDFIKNYRNSHNISIAEASHMVGVTHAGVTVFESSSRPQIVSVGKYSRGLGINFDIVVKNSKGDPVIPSNFMSETDLDKLNKELEMALSVVVPDAFSASISKNLKKVRLSLSESRKAVAEIAAVTESTVMKAENSHSRLDTFGKVASALDRNLMIVVDGDQFSPEDAPAALDAIRSQKGVTVSEQARRMGTTYRAIKIFPKSSVTSATFKKYADSLGVKVSHKITK